jgi:hypothetical protein
MVCIVPGPKKFGSGSGVVSLIFRNGSEERDWRSGSGLKFHESENNIKRLLLSVLCLKFFIEIFIWFSSRSASLARLHEMVSVPT